ncbi:hypothetical protein AB595_01900 [Massilia sp. WF1]|uniref:DUF1697 domain-containing protein n=1 Tax=unclassified Massilia TaxID=2609279 RepID=UPI00064981C9|nr:MULTISPECIES: DUF1697 domain-containing protein [unclassified Massilia]ALK99816.1 hypothetical protein AM586_24150 [Massilia sp. WG5]KLU38777.1 hypothetical protein AB595_01900 [Massilia sp. WF1]
MTRKCYVALLRGVNVGRAKRIAMADLRKLVGDLGYAEVRSVLNSGNLVFSGPARPQDEVAGEIEDALVLKLGVAARVLVLDAEELAAVIAGNPLLGQAGDHARLLVFVLSSPHADPQIRESLEALCGQNWHPGAAALGGRAAYVWCPGGILDSAAAAALGKQLGDTTTSRNWATLLKLHTLCMEAA